ncbi:AsmA-like C-terminal region-containing protein [Gracilimonas sp.]|uniref:AsmA family protein n=1 Tax=Gracilimonas sp. TaxID=1974203 RepID=UPI002871D3FA|nr:AsmA-like C-terminal region-containing protein [Gracilimonas sp.]
MSSSSNDFGELLKLLPPEYDDALAGLETRGGLNIEGTISGAFSDQLTPEFNFYISVEDGYLKNPDLPNAIEDIQLSFVANNDQISIQNFEARAADNTVNISGSVLNPITEDISYDLLLNGDIDLATIEGFYPITEYDIEQLSGVLNVDVNAKGAVDSSENAVLEGSIVLNNGLIKYIGVERAIENIQVDIVAESNRMDISQLRVQVAQNTLDFRGTVYNPLNPAEGSVDVTGDVEFDLSTIKEFYPIDEDSLELRGQLSSQINLRGAIEPLDIENILKSSTVNLTDGYLAHYSLGEPIRDMNFSGTVAGALIEINEAEFKTGNNSLTMSGSVQDYLSDDPVFDVNMRGNAKLGDIGSYYSLEPWIQELTGDAEMNISAAGPARDPLQVKLNGNLNVSDVSAIGDSLLLPVSDLSGQLSISPESMQLSDFTMNFGSSDIQLEGGMEYYLGFLKEDLEAGEIPTVTGMYSSKLLTIDEMIDWDEETDPNEPFPIELPEMNASVSAQIDRLVIFGINLTNVSGNGEMSPVNLRLDEAKATMFEGTATGSMNWEIPEPTNTKITFSGNLDQLIAESFFRDTGFLGPESTIHEYIDGTFSANVEYSSNLNSALSPEISSNDAEGSFGMTKARLNGHPIQLEVAKVLKIEELENVALDEWQSDFSIKDEILTFQKLNLTSGNIGLEMDGTHHMVTDSINYKARIALPGQFKSGIASVIGDRATNALQQENGTIAVPLLITGTFQKPNVRPDQNVIKKIVEDYLKERGGNLLKNLID